MRRRLTTIAMVMLALTSCGDGAMNSICYAAFKKIERCVDAYDCGGIAGSSSARSECYRAHHAAVRVLAVQRDERCSGANEAEASRIVEQCPRLLGSYCSCAWLSPGDGGVAAGNEGTTTRTGEAP